MKLAIKAELVYTFAHETQSSPISRRRNPTIRLSFRIAGDSASNPTAVRQDAVWGPQHSRRVSGEVAILYQAMVENNLRQLLPSSGRQHLWSDLPNDVLPFLLPSRFCPSDKFMRFAQREFGGAGDGVARVMAILDGFIAATSIMCPESAMQRRRRSGPLSIAPACAATSRIWASLYPGHWAFPRVPSAPMRFNWHHPTSTPSSRCFSKTTGG